MKSQNTIILSAVAVCGMLMSPVVAAQDPRCDDEEGRAKGLCNAYLHGVECDKIGDTLPKQCERILSNYRDAVGDPEAIPGVPPYEPGSCPCEASFAVYGWPVDSTTTYTTSVSSEGILSLRAESPTQNYYLLLSFDVNWGQQHCRYTFKSFGGHLGEDGPFATTPEQHAVDVNSCIAFLELNGATQQ